MALIRAFRGIRPRDDLAGEVIAPPYDVLSEDEAKAMVVGRPSSFLHVTRPDVDLPDGADAHGPEAYAVARRNLDHFVDQGWVIRDEEERLYLYRQTWRGRTQTGLLALCSVDEYDRGEIKKHELTRPDKEQDRVDHIEALDVQTGLVFLAYRDRFATVTFAMAEAAGSHPEWLVETEDGVRHELHVVKDPFLVQRLIHAFAEVPALYVADGHHRSAAASRVCAARGGSGTSGWFLAGIFPDSQLTVLAYNRLVADLHGHTPAGFLEALGACFDVTPDVEPIPEARGQVTMYLGGRWYRLVARDVPDDPVGCLDVAVLQNQVLSPLLGIENPRTDTRIRFVGGIRGHEALQTAVDRGEAAVAFHMFPTGMDQLFSVADADMLMPPKSTWFEPKLRGGVVAHKLS